MKHIGIAGPLASGKSTFARLLKEKLEARGCSVVIVPMAQAIKELVTSLSTDGGPFWRVILATAAFRQFGYTHEQSYRAGIRVAEAFEKYYVPDEKPRKLLQLVGTEIGRDMLDQDIWVKRVQAKIAELDVDFVLTDDIRFENEARVLDYLVTINLNGEHGKDAYARNTRDMNAQYLDTNHVSEQGLMLTETFPVPQGSTTCGFMPEHMEAWADRFYTWSLES